MPLTFTAERETAFRIAGALGDYYRRELLAELDATRGVLNQEVKAHESAQGKLDAERAAHQETRRKHEEQEAACCPEDVGFSEYIGVLQKQLQETQAKLEAQQAGHKKACYYCGDATNNLAANPGKWAIPLCHPDDPGVVKWHHIGCVSERCEQLAETQAKLDAAWKEARSLGEEYGISAEYLEALICGIGDKAAEKLEETQAIARELVEALEDAASMPIDGDDDGKIIRRWNKLCAKAKGVLPENGAGGQP